MTRLPDKHPICGHLVGTAYKGTLELTGNQTVQTDEETYNTVETAKKRTVESGTEGSLKASLTGVGASLKGYIKGKRSKSNKKSSSDIHRQSEAAAISQTIRIESVNNLEDADRLGCQDPDCPLNDDRQKIRIVEDMRVDPDELTNAFDDKELTEKNQRHLDTHRTTTELEDDQPRNTANSNEPIGDPYHQSHTPDRSVKPTERDNDQNEPEQPETNDPAPAPDEEITKQEVEESHDAETLRAEEEALAEERKALEEERETLREDREIIREDEKALKEERETLREDDRPNSEERKALREEEKELRNERRSLREEEKALRAKENALREEREALTAEEEAVERSAESTKAPSAGATERNGTTRAETDPIGKERNTGEAPESAENDKDSPTTPIGEEGPTTDEPDGHSTDADPRSNGERDDYRKHLPSDEDRGADDRRDDREEPKKHLPSSDLGSNNGQNQGHANESRPTEVNPEANGTESIEADPNANDLQNNEYEEHLPPEKTGTTDRADDTSEAAKRHLPESDLNTTDEPQPTEPDSNTNGRQNDEHEKHLPSDDAEITDRTGDNVEEVKKHVPEEDARIDPRPDHELDDRDRERG